MTIRIGLFVMLSGLVATLNTYVPHPPRELSSPIAKNATLPSDPAEPATQLPLSFEPNAGQTDESVKFLARGHGYTLFLTDTEAVFRFSVPPQVPALEQAGRALTDAKQTPAEDSVLRMSFRGATNPVQKIEGKTPLPGKSNYFIGSNTTKWRKDIANYTQAAYLGLYPGIDLIFRGNVKSALEYDFIVAPHADSGQILLHFDGAQAFRIDSEGNLEFDLPSGPFRQHKPIAYQERSGKKTFVETHFVIRDTGDVAFEVADYDHDLPLVIDPALTLIYSTYLGGQKYDSGPVGLFVDPSGNAYVSGYTNSLNFPRVGKITSPGLKDSYGGGNWDGFVAKLSPDGKMLLYSTFIGGNAIDYVTHVVADHQGQAVICGITESPDFPTTVSLSPTPGGFDGFAMKLGAEGNSIIYSTRIGGTKQDEAHAVAVDSTGAAYVTGIALSGDFPIKNAAQPRMNGSTDAYLTKISPDGTSIVFSTFFGGEADEIGKDIAIDSSNYAYIVGFTTSTHFPVAHTPNAGVFQATYGGGDKDAFINVFDPNGGVWYATYLGGDGWDEAGGVAVHGGQAYITGTTGSNNFPLANPYQSHLANPGLELRLNDFFVTKIAADGGSLVYSTYLGGTGDDHGADIDVDADGNAFVVGYTQSGNFPMENAFQDKTKSGQTAVISELDPTGKKLLWSTFFGGSKSDSGGRICLDEKRNIYVAGAAASADFPTKVPFQDSNGGNDDAFVAKFGKGGRVYLR